LLRSIKMRRIIRLYFVVFLSLSLLFCLSDIAQARGGDHGGYHSSGYRSGGYRSSGHSSYKSSGRYKSSSSGSKSIKLNRSAPRSKSTNYTPSKSSKNYTPSSATGVKRDSKRHIERSSKAKKEFMKQTGYPNGRTGYVVDHVVPLKRGGADTPSNMQWQTKEAAKAKDKIE